MTKTFLFIGFSFTDPKFSYICAHLRTHLKGNMREHYCFLKLLKINELHKFSKNYFAS